MAGRRGARGGVSRTSQTPSRPVCACQDMGGKSCPPPCLRRPRPQRPPRYCPAASSETEAPRPSCGNATSAAGWRPWRRRSPGPPSGSPAAFARQLLPRNPPHGLVSAQPFRVPTMLRHYLVYGGVHGSGPAAVPHPREYRRGRPAASGPVAVPAAFPWLSRSDCAPATIPVASSTAAALLRAGLPRADKAGASPPSFRRRAHGGSRPAAALPCCRAGPGRSSIILPPRQPAQPTSAAALRARATADHWPTGCRQPRHWRGGSRGDSGGGPAT